MAKKQRKSSANDAMGQLFNNEFAGAVRNSAQQIWQAGLAAFAKAQGEGGKVFDSLVKEGVSIQRKTQSAAEEKLGDVTSRMTSLAGDVQNRAGQQWDKLESIFEERVAKALPRLGVPSSREMDDLARRVDALSATVAKLAKEITEASRKPRAASAKSAPKVATKRAASAGVKRAAKTSRKTT